MMQRMRCEIIDYLGNLLGRERKEAPYRLPDLSTTKKKKKKKEEPDR